jgi:hypothetical protein
VAFEVRNFAVTIPAGTPIAAPTTTALVMPARIVRSIRWRVPPGPHGLMGFALGAAGVAVIPYGAGQWLVADDESDTITLEDQISSGAWQVFGYNTGAQAHVVYLTFFLDPPQGAGATVPAALVPLDIGSGASGGSIVGDTGGLILPPAPDLVPAPAPAPVDTGGLILPPDALPPPSPAPTPAPPPPPAGPSGYDIARTNATAAVQAATGGPVTVTRIAPPAPGTVEGDAYDAGKQAALAALGGI